MTEKQKILVIDDEPQNIRLIKLDVEDYYDVLEASDGQQG